MKHARITESKPKLNDLFEKIYDKKPPKVNDSDLEEARIAAFKRPELANRI